jgi:hypothetical protein
MPARKAHHCQCHQCQQEAEHPLKQQHAKMKLLFSLLNPQQRRLYAAIEADGIGRGGDGIVCRITGISRKTIKRAHAEVACAIAGEPPDAMAKPVTGRRRGPRFSEEKYPGIETALEALVAGEVAGDPMKDQKWIRSSLRKLCPQLKEQHFPVGRSTVQRLLKKMGFTLKMNEKRRKGNGSTSPDRDSQFRYIASLRQEFSSAGLPIISVDTKKKEGIGNFKNNGKSWSREAEQVNRYDFTSLAVCRAIPYGIYDVGKKKGYVYVGTSGDTPEFATDALSKWWEEEGRREHPGASKVMILADCGGCNNHRSRAWKLCLQTALCDRWSLTATVCHYPPGCSKWNPIERLLFSQISTNWAGKPLRTLETVLGYIRGTSTTTGLSVKAQLMEGEYKTGQRIARAEMEKVMLQRHTICPDWNYTISPRQ